MTAVTWEPAPPKRIPVNGRPIRLRWLQQIIWLVLAANVAVLIISALHTCSSSCDPSSAATPTPTSSPATPWQNLIPNSAAGAAATA